MTHSYKVHMPRWAYLGLVIPVAMLLLFATIPVPHKQGGLLFGSGFSLMALIIVMTLGALYLMSRRRVEVGEGGVEFVHFKGGMPQRSFTWNQLRSVEEAAQLLFGRYRLHTLRITLNDGHQFMLNIDSLGMSFTPLNANSPPLRDAILNNAGQSVIPIKTPIPGFEDLGREVGHVTYASLALLVLGTVLIVLGANAHYLFFPQQGLFIKGVALIAGLLAVAYQRRIANIGNALLPAAMFAGGAAALAYTVPLLLMTTLSPVEKVTFVLKSENLSQQYWESAEHMPALKLTISADPTRLLYSTGQTHDFPLHKGPFGILTLAGTDYRAVCNAPSHPPHPVTAVQEPKKVDTMVRGNAPHDMQL